MAVTWDGYTFDATDKFLGIRFRVTSPRLERRIDGFAGTDGVIITDFGQREQTITMTAWAKESEVSDINAKIGNSSTLAVGWWTDDITGAVLERAEWGDFFLVNGTQYCRARLTWVA